MLLEYQGEEYEVLLRYVADEQGKIKNRRSDDDGDKEKVQYTRNWYTPWKKTPVKSEGLAVVRSWTPSRLAAVNMKLIQIPDEWLNTERTKGITTSEAETRRKDVGYNELER